MFLLRVYLICDLEENMGKTIKGSPYPRGYYECSTLTEHNHPMPTQRNSRAGSAREKPTTPSSDDPSKYASSPFMSPVTPNSRAPEKLESSRDDLAEGDDDDNQFRDSSMALEDDFFAGLEDFIVGPVAENCFDHSPANFQFPWLASHSTSTAAGGG